jgi:hypothetical protein
MGVLIKRMCWAGLVARIGKRTRAYRVLVGKPEGKRPLGRLRRRWEKILKLSIKKSVGRTWTRFIWCRIQTSGGLL